MINRNEDLCRGCKKDCWGVGARQLSRCWEMIRILVRTINLCIVANNLSCRTECPELYYIVVDKVLKRRFLYPCVSRPRTLPLFDTQQQAMRSQRSRLSRYQHQAAICASNVSVYCQISVESCATNAAPVQNVFFLPCSAKRRL